MSLARENFFMKNSAECKNEESLSRKWADGVRRKILYEQEEKRQTRQSKGNQL